MSVSAVIHLLYAVEDAVMLILKKQEV